MAELAKTEDLRDRSDPTDWLMRYLQHADIRLWNRKQTKGLLPLAWDDKKSSDRTAWSTEVRKHPEWTQAKVEASFLERFDPRGVSKLAATLCGERQPTMKGCAPWFDDICHRWYFVRRWSPDGQQLHDFYLQHLVKDKFRNLVMIDLLDEFEGKLTENSVARLCRKADNRTQKHEEATGETFVAQVHVPAPAPAVPQPHAAAAPRRQNRARAVGPPRLVKASEVKSYKAVFGRQHEDFPGQVCAWHTCTAGCTNPNCPFLPHRPRSNQPCPEGIQNFRACEKGVFCGFKHQDNKHHVLFPKKGTPDFNEYIWFSDATRHQ